MQVNKTRDLIERVLWTFIETYIGLGAIDWLSKGINLSVLHQFYASLVPAAIATVKVLIAQRSSSGDGAAIPGGIETKK